MTTKKKKEGDLAPKQKKATIKGELKEKNERTISIGPSFLLRESCKKNCHGGFRKKGTAGKRSMGQRKMGGGGRAHETNFQDSQALLGADRKRPGKIRAPVKSVARGYCR